MDSIMDIIKKRISIRAYTDQPLSDGIINSILEAARYAPSARNAQELEYKVITNKVLIRRLSDRIIAELQSDGASLNARPGVKPLPTRPDHYYNSPLLIVITGPRENLWTDADTGIAAQNIMLYATSVNLGSCFIGMTRLIEKDPELMRELHITEDKKIAGAVVCGYSNEKPVVKEKHLQAEFFK